MLTFSVVFVILELCVTTIVCELVSQNTSCPLVAPMELDLKNLDGKWYIISIASDMGVEGDCGSVVFSHKTDNTTDVSISWVSNSTVSFYNGSVLLTVDPNSNSTEGDLLAVTYTDQRTESYSFLTLDYEHFAVIFACYNSDDGGNSTYELWELSRTAHVKPKHIIKMKKALTEYGIENTTMYNFKNSGDCVGNSGVDFEPSLLVLITAAMAMCMKMLYF